LALSNLRKEIAQLANFTPEEKQLFLGFSFSEAFAARFEYDNTQV
jgi:hypothetical protein